MLQKTTAQKKIAKLRKRVRIVQGGTSASKTFTILPFLITHAIQTPRQVISVVSESMPHLKRGAQKDFINIMQMTNIWQQAKWNGSDHKYTFDNGSYIEFFSADQPDKMRGSRRDVLFINECNNIPFETYHQLAIRTRSFIYLDFNPSEEFWVHTELIDDKDSDFIILTYKDNEALDPNLVKEIEKAKGNAFFDVSRPDLFASDNIKSEYWSNWWRVYGMGEVGMLQGVIYKDWKIIDNIPAGARLLGGGLDFGYSGDPTAGVLVYKYNDGIILDEVLYRTEMTNREIYKALEFIDSSWVADSAEPKSIRELQLYGMRVQPAVKGPDSVNHGIQLLQSVPVFMTKRSTNMIKEQRSYCWNKNRSGETLATPIDKWNHCLDAARYFANNNFRSGYGTYGFG